VFAGAWYDELGRVLRINYALTTDRFSRNHILHKNDSLIRGDSGMENRSHVTHLPTATLNIRDESCYSSLLSNLV
jgi:hypothetical protein